MKSRGEQGCEITPLPATEAINRYRKKGQGSERQRGRHERPTGCKYAAWLEGKKRRKKKKHGEKKKNRIIKFSFVLPGVILFCRGIKWNEEVKKRKEITSPREITESSPFDAVVLLWPAVEQENDFLSCL